MRCSDWSFICSSEARDRCCANSSIASTLAPVSRNSPNRAQSWWRIPKVGRPTRAPAVGTAPAADGGDQLLARNRGRHQEALRGVAAERGQHLPVVGGFHAFGDGFQAQLAREVEAGFHHRALARLRVRIGDEALVDLEFGEGHLRELRQRGIAGAEIVDGQAEALQPQAREHAEPARGIGHHQAFGDFQHHVGRIHAQFLHQALVMVGGSRVVQRRRRYVHRQAQAHAGGVPLPLPLAGLHQHRLGQRLGQPMAFDHRDEMPRQHHVAIRAPPTRQRLDADRLAVAELDLRLEPRHQFAGGERGAHVLAADLDRLVFPGLGLALLVLGQHRLQLVAGQRLLHAAEHEQAVGAGHGLHGVEQRRIERADQRHRARQPALGDMADEFDAVHARHVEVDEDHVRRLRLAFQQCERGSAVGRFQRILDAAFGEQAQGNPALEAVILHHQHT
jgi:hypothetical protein